MSRTPAHRQPSRVTAALLRVRKVGGVLLAALLFAVSGGASAQQIKAEDTPLNVVWYSGQPPVTFDCNTLYAGEGGSSWNGTTSGNGGRVFKIDLDNITPSSRGGDVRTIPLYKPRTSSPNWDTREPVASIALGKADGENLSMWHWHWDHNTVLTYMPNGTSATDGAWRRGAPPSTGPAYWNGGEFDQVRNKLILGNWSGNGGTFSNARFAIYDPLTGDSILSGAVTPKTSSDSTNLGNGHVSSDMAVDANGNFYVVVGSSPRWLVRIVPGTDASGNVVASGWTYNKVVQLTGFPSGADVWGMAFLNGKLYMTADATPSGYSSAGAQRALWSANLLSGAVTYVGSMYTTTQGDDVYFIDDLATCQTAPVIEGTVYNDVAGDGSVASDVGVEGITVEIFKDTGGAQPVFMGSQTTSGGGNYSFIVDSTNATYYIRVKQPQINGINAAQTYASAGGDQNIVTALCTNGSSTVEKTSSGICHGVNLAGSDKNTIQDIMGEAYILSKVVMTTDKEVAVADFGITTARDFGDAPNSYGTLSASGGPAHINGPAGLLRLGACVTTEADGQPGTEGSDTVNDQCNDGVTVVVDGREVPLQRAHMVAGKTYTIKAKVDALTSPEGIAARAQGYLNAWVGISGGAKALTFATKIASDLRDPGSGTISFDYTVPTGILGAQKVYFRFRWSTTPGLAATGNPLPAKGSDSNSPWVIDGEVEDYFAFMSLGQLRLSKISNGGTGLFNFDLKNNFVQGYPASGSESVTTTASGVQADQSDEKLHAFQSAGAAATFNELPPGGDWKLASVVCNDKGGDGTSVPVPVSVSGNDVTIPAASVKVGSDIHCIFTNGTAPKLTLNKTVGTRVSPTDQFTVQIKNGAIVSASATTSGAATSATTGAFAPTAGTTYTLTEIPVGGANLSNYTSTIACTNEANGSTTVLPSGTGTSFAVTPTYGDAITCTFTNTAQVPSPTQSALIVVEDGPKKADGIDSYTAKATIKDSSGTVMSNQLVKFTTSPSGSTAGPSCVTGTDGTCTVTWTSAMPGTYSITAKVSFGSSSAEIGGSPISRDFMPYVKVSKAVDSVAGGYLGGEFEITVVCGSNTKILKLADGESDTVIAQTGDSCTVSEAAPAASVVPVGFTNEAVISPSDFPVTGNQEVEVTNRIVSGTLPTATLRVTKTVTGADKAAGHITSNVFGIDVDCGPPVSVAELNLKEGQSGTVQAEIGAQCTISEPTLPAANAGYKYVANLLPSTVNVVAAGNSIVVENAVVPSTATLQKVTLTHKVTGEKNLSGYSATNKAFTVALNCGAGYNWTSVLAEGDISTYNVPTGASCTVATTASPTLTGGYGWYAHTYAPTSPFTVNGTVNEVVTHDIQLTTAKTITVTKVVDSVAGGYLGGEFEITVVCGSNTKILKLADGESDTVIAQTGDSCTVSEAAPAASVVPVGFTNEAVIGPSDFSVTDDQTVEVTNRIVSGTLPTATLRVTKTVTGADKAAGHITSNVFGIDVDCGPPVSVAELNLKEGQSGTVQAEIGAQCTISEPTLPAANAGYKYVANLLPSTVNVVAAGNSIVVENAVVPSTATLQKVTLTHKVTGEKNLSGYSATNKAFTVALNCGAGYNWTSVLAEGDISTYNVPTGASCTVATTASPTLMGGYGWYAHTYAPTSPFTVNGTVNEVVTHDIQLTTAKTITVTKVVDSVAGGYLGGEFEITVVCGSNTKILKLADGESDTVIAQTGDSCTVSEAAPAASVVPVGFTNEAVIGPSDFSVTDDQTVEVTNRIVSGTLPTATLRVTKTVTGADKAAGHITSNVFGIDVDCGPPVSVAELNLKEGQSGTVQAEIGAQCTISEPTLPAANAGYKYVANLLPSTVNVAAAGNSIVVENAVVPSTATLQKVTLTHKVTGEKNLSGYSATNKAFTVALNCGAGYNWTSVLAEGDISTYNVPTGASCTVATTASPTLMGGYGWYAHTYAPTSPFTVNGTVNEVVTHDIQLTTAKTITVTKVVDSVAGGYLGGEFEITVVCGSNTKILKLADGESDTVIAQTGDSCTVSEAAPAASVVPVGFTNEAVIGPSDFSVTDDQTVEVTNRIVSGTLPTATLRVTKTVTGADKAAGHITSNVFGIDVDCGPPVSVAELNLKEGQSGTVQAEIGAQCTISEPTLPAANAGYKYVANLLPSTVNVAAAGNSIVVENAVVPSTATLQKVTLTHKVTGEKNLSGYSATNKAFTVALNCGAGYNWTSVLAEGDISTYNVPTGASCTVATTASPTLTGGYGWYAHTYAPTSPFTVNGTVNEVVTHDIQLTTAKTITVTKVVDSVAGGYLGGEFEITVVCGSNTKILKLADGESDTVIAQTGDSCTVSEAAPAASVVPVGFTNEAVIGPSDFSVTDDQTVEVTNRIVSGTLPTATLRVTKTVTGADKAAGHITSNVFGIDVDCGPPVSVAELNLKEGQSGTVQAEIGAQCTISEPTLPAANAGYKYVANLLPSTVNVAAAGNSIVVENAVVPSTATLQKVTLTHKVTGEKNLSGYSATNKAFTVALNCGAGYNWTSVLAEGDISTYNVPTGASCTVATTASPTLTGGYGWYAHTYAPTSPFTVNGTVNEVVTHDIQLTTAKTITVTKVVDSVAGGYLGGEFEITVVCGSNTKILKLADGESDTVIAQTGDSCTVSEAAPAASVVPVGFTNEAVIGPSDFSVTDDQTVEVTNRIVSGTLPTATLRVTKTVTGADKAAGHITSNVFGIDVDCGPPVSVAELNLKEGQSGTVQAEIGAQCTISEPTLPAANAGYKYAANLLPSTVNVVAAGNSIVVENAVVPSTATLQKVTLTHKVTGEKNLSGYSATNKAFTVALNCGAGYNWTSVLAEGDISTYNVPTGASCTVATTASPTLTGGYGWYAHTYAPTSPFTVNGTVNEVVTHDIQLTTAKTITVTKVVDSVAGGYLGGEFEITVVCGSNTKILKLADGESDTVIAQTGDSCTVSEAAPAASVVPVGFTNEAVIGPSDFSVTDDQTVEVTNRIVSGTLPTATLRVTKTVTGADKAAGHITSNVFGIDVDCGPPVSVAELNLKEGQSGTVQAEIGAQCTISEPTLPAANAGYKYVANLLPSTVNVVAAGNSIVVENAVVPSTATLQKVTLTHKVTGEKNLSGYSATNKAFTVALNCGAGYNWTSVLAEGDISTYNVPTGASCTVVTTASPTLMGGYGWYAHTYAPTSPFTVNGTVNEVVTHDIQLTTAKTITVTKVVDSVAGGYLGGEFEITVVCGSNTKILKLADGESDTVIAQTGDSCTVSEAASAASVVPVGFTNEAVIGPSDFSVTDDQTVEVTNRIVSGTLPTATLRVTKTVTGADKAAGHITSNVFGIDVDCGPPVSVAELNLKEGQSGTVQAEIGAQCTISEPTLPAANAGYKYAANLLPSTVNVAAAGNSIVVENAVVPSTATLQKVTLTHKVTGEKNLSGYSATNKAFTVALNCGAGYNWTSVLAEGDISTYNVPTGASCTVATTASPTLTGGYGWYAHTYAPTSPFTVNGTVNEVVTHDIQLTTAKTITVTKVVDSVAGGYLGGEFEITVVCGSNTKILKLADGESDTVIAQTGDSCTVSEAAPAASVVPVGFTNEAVIGPSDFSVTDDQTVEVTNRIVSGTLPTATLRVTKTVTGADKAAGHITSNVFGIDVDCGPPVSVAELNLKEGQSGTVQAEIGAQCTISEPTLPAANAGYKYAANLLPSTVNVVAAGNSIVVENAVVPSTATLQKVTLTHKVTGEKNLSGYSATNKAFTVALNCGAGYNWTSVLAEGDISTYNVPTGASCTVATTASPTLTGGYGWYAHTYAPTSPFTVNGTVNEVVTHDIQLTTAKTITVTKVVDSVAGGYLGGEFEITVVCGSNTKILKLADGESDTVIAQTGDSCTVSEAAPAASVVPVGFTNEAVIGPSDFSVTDDQTVEVTNRIVSGTLPTATLRVTKTVTGADKAAGHITSNVFGIDVDCGPPVSVAELNLKEGQSGTVQAEIGAQCTISEPTLPAANAGYKYVANLLPSTVNVVAAGNSIVVENAVVPSTATLQKVTLTHKVTGEKNLSGYSATNKAFTVALNCGAGYNWTSVLAEGDISTYNVPTGASCTVATTASPTLTGGYGWYAHTYAPTSPFTVNGTVNEVVTHDIQLTTAKTITVTKVVDSVAGGYLGGEFEITVVCGSNTKILKLADGESDTVIAQTGDSCTVSEAAPAASVVPVGFTNEAVIGPSDFSVTDDQTVEVTNRIVSGTLPTATLRVTKTVTGADKAAGHITSNVFGIDVDCGPPVSVAELNLKEGQSGTVQAEIGAQCTISEPTLPAANAGYKYVANLLPSTVNVAAAGNSIVVENAVVPSTATLQKVTLTHKVTGEKNLSGYSATNKAFTVALNCGAGYNWTSVLAEGDISTYNVPTGASCTVATTASPTLMGGYGWYAHTYAPTSPFTVNGTVNEVVTHDIQLTTAKTITVTKVVDSVAGGYLGGEFEITVVCGSNTKILKLADGESDTVIAQTGDSCTVSEAAPAASVVPVGFTNEAVIGPSDFSVTDDQTVEVTNRIVSGTLPTATLRVTKTVTGADKAAGHITSNVFGIDVDCGPPVSVAELNLKEGQSGTVQAEIGAQCTISEPTLPAANAGYKYVANLLPSTVNVAAAGNSIVVENAVVPSTATLQKVTLTHKVTGEKNLSGYSATNKAFTVALNCGAGYNWTSVLAEGDISTYNVPTGASCTVATTASPTLTGGYGWYAHTYAPTSPFTVNGTVNEVVTHDIQLTTAKTITVTKVVDSVAGGYLGGEFEITVVCGSNTKILKLADGESDTVIAQTGDSCTVSEAAPAASVVPVGFTNEAVIGPSDFSVTDDQTVEVTNRIVSGTLPTATLRVTKTVTGADKAAGHITSNVFGIDVDCGPPVSVAELNLKEGQSGTVQAEIGAQCTISEPTLPAANAGYKYVANLLPSTVNVVAAGNSIVVENAVVPSTATLQKVTLTHKVTGEKNLSGYSATNKAFTVALNCGAGYNWTSVLAEGDISTYNVPTGASCTVATTASPTLTGGYGWYAHTYAPTSPFTVNGTVNEVVTHDIQLTTAKTITVTKVVDSVAGGYLGGEFEITVVCGSNTKILKLADGESDTVIAQTGDSCTVSEAAPAASVVPVGFTNEAVIGPSDFSVTDDQTVEVTNRIVSGTLPTATLRVTKTVTGADKAAGHITSNVFGIDVDCGPPVSVAELNLKEGQSGTVQAEIGAQCTISEPTLPAANAGYKYVANLLPSTVNVVAAGNSIVVENAVVPSTATLQKVTLTHKVTGEKNLSGYSATNKAFTVALNCGAGYNWTSVLAEGDISTYNVPTGASCTVATTASPTLMGGYGWYAHTYAPTSPFTVNGTVNEVVTHDIQLTTAKTITVTKVVDSVAGGYLGGEFEITVVCGSNTKILKLADGESDTVIAQTGDSCTVSEAAPAASVVPVGFTNEAVIGPSDFSVTDDQTVEVTNRIVSGTLPTATLRVTKTVTGADKAAGHITSNVFGIDVDCGPPVSVAELNLKEGQSGTVQAEIGAQCTISEPTLPAANAGYKYAANLLPSTVNVVAAGNSIVVENAVVPSTATLQKVTLTHKVTGEKNLSGYSATNKAFTVALNCGAGYNWTSVLAEGDISTYNVPTGASCTVATTASPTLTGGYGWYAHTYAPTSPFTVNGTVNEVVTHDIQLTTAKTITVTKVVDSVAGGYLGGEFEITVVCGSNTKILKLADGESDTVIAQTGDSCTVSEAAPAASVVPVGFTNEAVIGPSDFSVTDDQTVEVTNRIVSGTLPTATLRVTKTVTGADKAAGHITSNVFGIDVDCGPPVSVAELNLKEGQSGTVQAEIGAQCTISEPTLPAANAGYKYVANLLPSTVNVAAAGNSIVVENAVVPSTATLQKVTLTHKVTGEKNLSGYSATNKAFTVALNCGAGYNWTSVLAEGDISTYNVPTGASCTVATTASPTLMGGYGWYAHTYAPTSPFTVNGTVNEVVTHDIQLTTAKTITVTKVVDSVAGGYLGGEFEITVVCGSNTKILKLADGESDTVIAQTGDSCTVSEAAPAASVVPVGFTNEAVIGPSDFSVTDDQTVEVTNRIVSGTLPTATLRVTKTVTGADKAAGHITSNVFGIDVDCGPPVSVAELNLKEGQSGTVQAEIGAQCTISEPTLPAANAGYKYVANLLPSTVNVAAAGNSIVVENAVVPSTATLQKVTLTHKVTGEKNLSGYSATNKAFTVALNCGAGYNWTSVLAEGDISTYNVPTGASCTVATTASPTLMGGYGWYAHTYAPTSPFTVGNGTVNEVVTHDIQLASGLMYDVTLTNTVSGDRFGSGYENSDKTFTVKLDCGVGYVWTPALLEGVSQTFPVPSGSTCTTTVIGWASPLNTGYYFIDAYAFTKAGVLVDAATGIEAKHQIRRIGGTGTVPIPTLDVKALLLLIALMSGAVFWQRRRRS